MTERHENPRDRLHPSHRSANPLPIRLAMNGNNTYAQRQTEVNKGEVLFEEYCKEKGYEFVRIGFNEKKGQISNFFLINPLLRNIPDYFVNTPNGPLVVQVKGSPNFKKKEIDLMPLFLENYSSKEAPLVYAFCFEFCAPKLVYPERLIELYKNTVDRQWPDGVTYRCLQL